MTTRSVLVLWDIDRTLLYVGNIDRQVYREAFAEVVGRPAERLPARGTGVTMPLAVRGLLLDNGVPEDDVPALLPRIIRLLPELLSRHLPDIRRDGQLMPGAVTALRTVRKSPELLPTVVTGNLQPNAEVKLRAFDLHRYVETGIGGYASDDSHRPALVAVAQERARVRHENPYGRQNTVIIGDSLEDIRTGVEGGARVIAVASGTTPAERLGAEGADAVLPDLTDVDLLLKTITELAHQG
ncbi:HAD family hydrolase [Streptomyces mangrovi]|uniref:HAD family hydrolase n=1 Tax=Streptomyces mangrovi TaxID=1206892 RepID=UPI00399C91AD